MVASKVLTIVPRLVTKSAVRLLLEVVASVMMVNTISIVFWQLSYVVEDCLLPPVLLLLLLLRNVSKLFL